MGSKCQKIDRLISDYIDGVLSERQVLVIESHIDSCWVCAREVVDLRRIRALLKNYYVGPEVSDAYYARFTTRLQQRIEQSAPTMFDQRLAAALAHLGWQLLTQFYHYTDRFCANKFISIRQHVLPYYVLALAMTVLIVVPFMVKEVSIEDKRSGSHLLSGAVQPAVTLTVGDETIGQPTRTRRNVKSRHTTNIPAVESGADVWEFIDEPGVDRYILITPRRDSTDSVSDVALAIDSALLVYAESLVQGTGWARLMSRNVLTEGQYALLLLQGINTGQHVIHRYQRKRRGHSRFSTKLLDVPLEMLSVEDVYDPIEL